MVEVANGMCVRLVLIASGSFEEVCSRLEDLMDTLPTLLSDNEGLSKDDLVFSNMGQNEKELNRRFCVLSKGMDQMGHWTQKARVRRATRKV
ncbi:hypothetical protein Tco_1239630 [Tanacetum coccineum]